MNPNRDINIEDKAAEAQHVKTYGEPKQGKLGDYFGPAYGFAQLGNYYGQNMPGFWERQGRGSR